MIIKIFGTILDLLWMVAQSPLAWLCVLKGVLLGGPVKMYFAWQLYVVHLHTQKERQLPKKNSHQWHYYKIHISCLLQSQKYIGIVCIISFVSIRFFTAQWFEMAEQRIQLLKKWNLFGYFIWINLLFQAKRTWAFDSLRSDMLIALTSPFSWLCLTSCRFQASHL